MRWRILAGVVEFKFPATKPFSTYAATGCPLTTARPGGLPPLVLGITGVAPNQAFLGAAAGNIDFDSDLDCWSLSTVDRVDARGALVSKGQPYLEHDDREPTWWQRITGAR